MTCADCMAEIGRVYQPVGVLSSKNGGRVIRMRHRENGRDLIVRQYSAPVPAYEMLRCVRHKNLPEIYDVISCTDGQIVLEEFVDGITVAQVLESDRYTYGGAKRVLQGVGAAAWTLHDMGLVHRDIKPENVMVTADGEVKLIDLNASRRTDPAKQKDTQVLGTVGYAAPEQLGIGQTDHRTDIYALGVLLNVMLTGKHPGSAMAKGKGGRIVLRCTQIDPNRRYQTAAQFIEAL